MRFSGFIILLCLLACGKKTPVNDFKVSADDEKSFLLSPDSTDHLTKIFNVYSPDGKMTISQIKSVSATKVPVLHSYLEKIQIYETDQRYSASTFLELLAESNSVIRWSLKDNLRGATGWQKAFEREFPNADQRLRQSVISGIDEYLSRNSSDKKLLLTQFVQAGLAFNLFDAIDTPQGSLVLLDLKLEGARREARGDLNSDALRLLKFVQVLKYLDIIPVPSEATLQKNEDQILSHFSSLVTSIHPKLDAKKLRAIFADNYESFESPRTTSQHRQRYLGQLVSFRPEKPSMKAGVLNLWLYEHYVLTCQDQFKVVSLSEWLLKEGTVSEQNLNPFDESFCARTKNIFN